MKEAPPRKRTREKQGDGFVYVRCQKLDKSTSQGWEPVYNMNKQMEEFCEGVTYERVADRSNAIFDVFRVPKEAHETMMKGLQDKANSRVKSRDRSEKLTSYNRAAEDKITDDQQTDLDSLGKSLPNG